MGVHHTSAATNLSKLTFFKMFHIFIATTRIQLTEVECLVLCFPKSLFIHCHVFLWTDGSSHSGQGEKLQQYDNYEMAASGFSLFLMNFHNFSIAYKNTHTSCMHVICRRWCNKTVFSQQTGQIGNCMSCGWTLYANHLNGLCLPGWTVSGWCLLSDTLLLKTNH